MCIVAPRFGHTKILHKTVFCPLARAGGPVPPGVRSQAVGRKALGALPGAQGMSWDRVWPAPAAQSSPTAFLPAGWDLTPGGLGRSPAPRGRICIIFSNVSPVSLGDAQHSRAISGVPRGGSESGVLAHFVNCAAQWRHAIASDWAPKPPKQPNPCFAPKS